MQFLANIVSNFVMVNGIRTHFVEAGSGQPLVLCFFSEHRESGAAA